MRRREAAGGAAGARREGDAAVRRGAAGADLSCVQQAADVRDGEQHAADEGDRAHVQTGEQEPAAGLPSLLHRGALWGFRGAAARVEEGRLCLECGRSGEN